MSNDLCFMHELKFKRYRLDFIPEMNAMYSVSVTGKHEGEDMQGNRFALKDRNDWERMKAAIDDLWDKLEAQKKRYPNRKEYGIGMGEKV